MSGSEKKIFDSYNAMSRPAMYWGVPIMPMIGIVMGGMLCSTAAGFLLSWVWGAVVAFLFAGMLLAFRLITSVDDRYSRRIWFSIRRLWLNLKYGKQLLLTPSNQNWSRYYGSRYARKRYAARGSGRTDEVPRS